MTRWIETPGGVAEVLNRYDDEQRRRAAEAMTPAERDAKMMDMYHEQGLPMTEIAKHFNVSRQRVHQIIGPTVKRPHYGRAKKERRVQNLREAYNRILDEGSSAEQEAKLLGIAKTSLVSALAEIGLKIPSSRPPSPLHGTYYRYSRGCRCDECQDARRAVIARWRERGPRTHGKESSYRVYGCRCDACKKAGAEGNRRSRERRKLRDKQRMPDE